MNKTFKPYVYCVTFKITGHRYIGVRFAKKCYVGDILEKYFTSSSIVHKLINLYGKDEFSAKVLKVFDSPVEAVNYERRLLLKINAAKNEKFLNESNAGTMHCNLDYITKMNKNKQYFTNGTKTIWLPEYVVLDSRFKLPEGFYPGKHYRITEETKLKISNTNKANGVMPKNCKNKKTKEHIEKLVDSRKEKMVIMKTRKWVTNEDGTGSKRVLPEELLHYLESGWTIGKRHQLT